MTYRERRERRAERLKDWAAAREAKQGALSEAARGDEAATGIPFGQPILVGHHSEGRHRAAIRKMDRAMAASVENSRKAESMGDRATTIERQLATSIYDDDPDAIERLREKLAKLEERRETIKADNAAFRKEHREELKKLTAYEKSQILPHPSYELTNLGGNITRTRQRIERLEREKANGGPRDRVMTARYGGPCEDCGRTIEKGELIRYSRANGARCETCPTTEGEG